MQFRENILLCKRLVLAAGRDPRSFLFPFHCFAAKYYQQQLRRLGKTMNLYKSDRRYKSKILVTSVLHRSGIKANSSCTFQFRWFANAIHVRYPEIFVKGDHSPTNFHKRARQFIIKGEGLRGLTKYCCMIENC